MGFSSLTEQEKSQVAFVHSSSSCDVLSTTVAKLFISSMGKWEFTGVIGAVSVILNRIEKTHYIKFIDLKTTKCHFEQELYSSFEYKKQRDFFHTFEGDSQVFGLSFVDIQEANGFYRQVSFAQSGKLNASSRLSMYGSSNVTSSKGIENKPKGFINKLFGIGNSSKQDLEISRPTSFHHNAHIGWHPERGFDIKNIPEEWKSVFQKSGIKDSELEDAKTAKFIMDIIGKAQSQPNTTHTTSFVQKDGNNNNLSTRPPIPSTNRRNPPPPPPTQKRMAPLPPTPTKVNKPLPPVAVIETPHILNEATTFDLGQTTVQPSTIESKVPLPPPLPLNQNLNTNPVAQTKNEDFLASIRNRSQGKPLKSIDDTPLPDLKAVPAQGPRSIIDILKTAMEDRRDKMREDANDDQEHSDESYEAYQNDDENDDDWMTYN